MFEIPRRGRQARNFECSENSRSQIVFQIDIFRRLALGAPGCVECWIKQWFYQEKLRMQKWAVFHLISKHNSLWIIDEFEKYEVRVNEPSVFFVRNGIPSKWRNGRAYMLCGFKPVCLYSYHLFILLAVKTFLYSIRKNRSRINYYILIAFDYFYRKCAI